DRMNACAFNKRANPFSARLNAVLGSDIGHFDVPDMMDVIPEAYELVDDGVITPEDFRDFTFTNAVRLWGTQNPKFFEGTAGARAAGAGPAEPKRAPASVGPGGEPERPPAPGGRRRAPASASAPFPRAER